MCSIYDPKEPTWLFGIIAAISGPLKDRSLGLCRLVAIASLSSWVSEHACHGLRSDPIDIAVELRWWPECSVIGILSALLSTYVVFVHNFRPKLGVKEYFRLRGSGSAGRPAATPHRARPGGFSAQTPYSTPLTLTQSHTISYRNASCHQSWQRRRHNGCR